MALTVDILLAVAVSNTPTATIRIANVNQRFPARTFGIPTAGDVEIDSSIHEWSNYFRAGLRGAIDRCDRIVIVLIALHRIVDIRTRTGRKRSDQLILAARAVRTAPYLLGRLTRAPRSEERRVGKECVP